MILLRSWWRHLNSYSTCAARRLWRKKGDKKQWGTGIGTVAGALARFHCLHSFIFGASSVCAHGLLSSDSKSNPRCGQHHPTPFQKILETYHHHTITFPTLKFAQILNHWSRYDLCLTTMKLNIESCYVLIIEIESPSLTARGKSTPHIAVGPLAFCWPVRRGEGRGWMKTWLHVLYALLSQTNISIAASSKTLLGIKNQHM